MSTSIILIPQAKDTFLYDDNFNLQGSVGEPQTTQYLTLTGAASRAGGVYIIQLNISSNGTRVNYFDFSANKVTRTLTSAGRYGDELGVHSFWELPDRNLLSVDVNTRNLVKLSSTDLSVMHTYGLVVNPLDGWPSPDGTKLAYMSGGILKCWDLVADAALADIKNFGANFIQPVWLANNTFIIYNGVFDSGPGTVYLTDATGTTIRTFGPVTFVEGVNGICASVLLDRLYILGVDEFFSPGPQGDIFTGEIYQLSTGTHLNRAIVNGPMHTTFVSFELGVGWLYIYESPISSVVIDCNSLIMTITGTGFPDNPNVQMTLNGLAFTSFTVQTTSPTVITVLMPGFSDGNYQVSVS